MLLFIGLAVAIGSGMGLPLENRNGHAVVIGVEVEGRGGFRFLLDTGAQSSMINPRVAARLKLKPSYRVEVVTASGSAFVPVTRAARVAFGEARADDVELLIASLPWLDVDGVLGQNVLSRFNYLLDYHRRRVRFEPDLPAGHPAAAVPFETVEGRPVVRVHGPQDRNWRLVLDTGAADLVLFLRVPGVRGASVSLSTVAGAVTVDTALIPRLQIGGTVLLHVSAAMAPSGRVQHEDGLLPGRMFRSIYVNNRDKYLVLNPHGG